MCARCEYNKEYEPGVWFGHIWFLFTLQRGGYPFGKDDLTIEEWQDLGILKEAFERWRTGSR